MRKVKIVEQTFSAAHYIKGHPKCQALHGHTYFVRNVEVLYDAPENEYVDIGVIKNIIQGFDHKLLIPSEDAEYWLHRSAPCKILLVAIPGQTTVENIAEYIASLIKTIPYVKSVRLEVYEGPNEGTVYDESS